MSELLEYRVKLRSAAGELVVFNVSPEVSESRSVNYKTVDPIHAPGQIFAYVNSTSRTFQLSAVKIVSRNREEAEKNLRDLWLLRSWTMPAFGKDPLSAPQREMRQKRLDDLDRFAPESDNFIGTELGRLAGRSMADVYGADLHGAPPQVIELSAYAHDGHYGTSPGHINRVPTVITSLTIPYPTDCDYFPTSSGVPMPTIMMIDIALSETHAPKEYEEFNLGHFKRGVLKGF